MNPVYFRDQIEFRKWLEKNHNKESEIIVGYYKVATGKPSLSWSQSVGQAICFGWIDGIRRSIDEERYCIRFTPRKPKSVWSNVNIKKVEELIKKGLMTETGLRIYDNRKDNKSGIYSFEKEAANLDDASECVFRSNQVAWDFFVKQAPSYRKTRIYWIMSAKQEATRISRLNKLIIACEKHIRLF
ncbi:MAG: YdeI family protein [Bacteroidales bacterium]